MYRVNVMVDTWTSREADPEDNWDIGDRDGNVTGARIVSRGYDKSYNDVEVTDIEPPFYAVYAGYYTGCTFGRDYEGTMIGVVKTEEDAKALVDEARTFKGFGSLSNGFHVPWNGYFERLDRVQYERLS